VDEPATRLGQESLNPRPSFGSFRTVRMAHIDADAFREDLTRRFGCGKTKHHLFCWGTIHNAGFCELIRNIGE
jgi:hypothetical protein